MAPRLGMTLIEIMIVLTLIMVVSAVVIPLATGMVATERLRRGADLVRAEWAAARRQAISEGRIVVFRAAIGEETLLIDRVLDTYFTAALSTEMSYDETGRMRQDVLTTEEFSATETDYLLRSPNAENLRGGSRRMSLPASVFAADVITLTDDRAALVLGAATARMIEDDENTTLFDDASMSEIRLGEERGEDGRHWSAPIFFFPDGSTSTAALLLKGDRGRLLELRLRGLTGTTTLCPITTAENYIGEMNATAMREK